jgi:hypothetical protein
MEGNSRSKSSAPNPDILAPDGSADLNLPEFEAPQVEHWPSKMSWSDAMRIFAPARARYMREFDSPQQRMRDKNPEPFRLP